MIGGYIVLVFFFFFFLHMHLFYFLCLKGGKGLQGLTCVVNKKKAPNVRISRGFHRCIKIA